MGSRQKIMYLRVVAGDDKHYECLNVTHTESCTVPGSGGKKINLIGWKEKICEGGVICPDTIHLQVSLNAPPDKNAKCQFSITQCPAMDREVRVSLSINITKLLDFNVDPKEIFFRDKDWGIPQVVTLKIVDNSFVLGNITGTVNIDAAGPDPDYDGMTIDLKLLVIEDDYQVKRKDKFDWTWYLVGASGGLLCMLFIGLVIRAHYRASKIKEDLGYLKLEDVDFGTDSDSQVSNEHFDEAFSTDSDANIAERLLFECYMAEEEEKKVALKDGWIY